MFKITAELCSRVTSNDNGVYRYDSILFTYGYVNRASEVVRRRFAIAVGSNYESLLYGQVKTWAWEVLRKGEVDKGFLSTTLNQLSVVAMQRWNDQQLCRVFHQLSSNVLTFECSEDLPVDDASVLIS
jgi:hypothetical protein